MWKWPNKAQCYLVWTNQSGTWQHGYLGKNVYKLCLVVNKRHLPHLLLGSGWASGPDLVKGRFRPAVSPTCGQRTNTGWANGDYMQHPSPQVFMEINECSPEPTIVYANQLSVFPHWKDIPDLSLSSRPFAISTLLYWSVELRNEHSYPVMASVVFNTGERSPPSTYWAMLLIMQPVCYPDYISFSENIILHLSFSIFET